MWGAVDRGSGRDTTPVACARSTLDTAGIGRESRVCHARSTKRPDKPRTASLSAHSSDSVHKYPCLPRVPARPPCAPTLTSFDNSSHHAPPSPALATHPALPPHPPTLQPASPPTHDSPQPIDGAARWGVHMPPHTVPGAARGAMGTLHTSLFSHLASFLERSNV